MANAVGPQEISELSHSEKFNKGKLGSFVYAPDHYFSTLDISETQLKAPIKHPGCLFPRLVSFH